MTNTAAIIDWPNSRLIVGREVELSRAQVDLLFVLATQGSGQPMDVDVLAECVFGAATESAEANNIRFHISGLRKKLNGSGVGITTRPGLGYALSVDEGMNVRAQRLSL